MRFNPGDRVRPTKEALRRNIWKALRSGVAPKDRIGTIVRCWQDTVEVKWDPPIGSLRRNGVAVSKNFHRLVQTTRESE